MKAHVLKGSKQEIAEGVVRINGDVREAIVFVDEPTPTNIEPSPADIFAEMSPHMVNVRDVDDSREAIYRGMDGE